MQKYFKISLVLLLTFMTFSLNAQNINIPDANFKSALIALGVDTNNDGEIQESEALTVETLWIESKGIVSLEGIEYFKNLTKIYSRYNAIISLNLSDLTKLNFIDFEENKISHIDLTNASALEYLRIPSNNLTSIDLSNTPKLTYLNLDGNPITVLNLGFTNKIKQLQCGYTELKSIDLSNLNLTELWCDYNLELEVAYIKNGISNEKDLYWNLFEGNTKLKYICADESEVDSLNKIANDYGFSNIIINSLCAVSTGGSFNRLIGQTKLDINNDGCDDMDKAYPYLNIKISNVTDSGYAISDIDGNFSIHLNAGAYSFEPIIEHQEYYTVSPKSATFTLPDTLSPSFCITPNGVHNDLSISVIPVRAARPGFSDATYKVVYKNQGTTTQSGTVDFNYEGTKMDFVSSTPIADNTTAGNVSFDFNNLKPFETRSALITMRTNAPTDNPAVNSGDVLEFTAVITGATDETPDDNLAILNQTVVGSFDPNDKTCLEGEVVSPELIGKNVHYLIRFENTGTANAENIVVTDYIDTTVFEISTLQITDASHTCHTQISQGNKVQFIFSDIQLPFTEPDKHGYVAFSIKLKENLVIGDSIKNKADIFFDYNLPIETNIAAAEINYKTVTYIGKNQTLQGSLDIYPNPSNGQFTLDLKADIKAPTQISILNVEGKTVFAKSLNHQNQINLSLDLKHLAKGVYLVKAQVENDVLSKKVVIQ